MTFILMVYDLQQTQYFLKKKIDMDRRSELTQLSGQIINGIMSADSSIFSKILIGAFKKNVAVIAVEIADKMIRKIDEIDDKQIKEKE